MVEQPGMEIVRRPIRLTLPVTGGPLGIANIRELDDWIRPLSLDDGNGLGLKLLADLLGGQYFEGSVVIAASGDTVFTHTLGRVPRMVALQIRLDGTTGTLEGSPAGAFPPSGNLAPWTTEKLYVRASVAGTYAFMVI